MGPADGIGFVEAHTPQHIILIRLLIAAILGGMIGFEREMSHGAAGLRTHILIAVASALGYYVIGFAVAIFAVVILGALRAFAHKIVGQSKSEE